MYLCLCNALDDTRIADAIRQGARRPRDIYRHCGCDAQCGRCTASLLCALRSAASQPSDKQDR